MGARLTATAAKGVRPLVGVGVSWIVLLSAVGLGLRMPAEERISPLSRAGLLDYASSGERFDPLRAAFIARILGLDLGVGKSGRILGSDRQRPAPGAVPRVIVTHPFNNDDFASAYPIPSIPFTAKTSTRAARRETAEPGDCGGVGGSVWYRYRPDNDLGLIATTFGTNYPTALGVFVGRDVGDIRMVGCNSNPTGNAHVAFPAKAGQTYFFQVAGPVGGGDLVFNLDRLGATERASVSTSGREGDGFSGGVPSISADGRYVAFDSFASTLVEGDTNDCPPYGGTPSNEPSCPDIFVHDRLTGVTERVSISSSGEQSNGPSLLAAISGNGRIVAFWSLASYLVPGDTNGLWDVFVYDRVTRVTSRVSVSSSGQQGTGPPGDTFFLTPSVSLSFDGRLVAFASDFNNLVDGDTNACTAPNAVDPGDTGHPAPATHLPGSAFYNCRDVFVHDRVAHTTTRVSVSSSGKEGLGDSASAFITLEGRYVVFSSDAPDLVEGDTNRARDVFVHDRATRTTELVSLSSSGRQGDSNSGGHIARGHNTISSDGRFVAFVSSAPNLVPEDGDLDPDTFVRDRLTGRTRMLSGAGPGESGNHSTISAEGRFVAFALLSPVVRGGETTYQNQLFVYDVWTDSTTQVSVSSRGEQADSIAHEPDISADGRFVAFWSDAKNLVDDDRNRQSDVFVHELGWAR